MLVQISRQKHVKQVLLEPRQSLALKHIVAAKCLVKVNKCKAYLRVLNPTHRDITLPVNEILATVSDIEPASVFTLSTEDSSSSANMSETNNPTTTSNDGDPMSNQTDSQSTTKTTFWKFLAKPWVLCIRHICISLSLTGNTT